MKKKQDKGDFMNNILKTMRVMRICLFLSVISTSLVFSASTYSQSTKLTLNLNDVTVKEVIQTIEDQSEFIFFYQDQQIDLTRRVSIRANDKNIEEVLNKLFEGTKNIYAISDRQVVVGLSRRQAEEALASLKRITGPLENLELQQKSISGSVTDSNGLPLPGVSVIVKGTSIGTVTGADGKFLLFIPVTAEILQFSFVGMYTQEVVIEGQTTFSIVMEEETIGLDEVVAIGYGTMRRSSVTGAISRVENITLDQVPISSVGKSLQGRLAGVHISNPNNSPGQPAHIIIRGRGSISAGNDPLVVVDGFAGGSLEQLSMHDIESIEVLKDAAAAAIYGSRGSGGVIIVTTRKGKTGAPQLNFNAYAGYSIPFMYDDWAGPDEWIYWQTKNMNRWFANDGYDPSIPIFGDPRRPLAYQVNPALAEGPWSNWAEKITRLAPMQNYNLSARGGTDNVQYYVSGTYNHEEGSLLTEYYKSYTFRANIDVKVRENIKLAALLNPSFYDRREAGHSMHDLYRHPPFVSSEQNPDGSWPQGRDYWAYSTMSSASPLDRLYNTEYFRNGFSNLGELSLSYEPIKGLILKSSVSTNISFAQQDNWSGVQKLTFDGSAVDSRGINLLNENILTYHKTLKDVHEFNGLLGASYQKSTSRSNQVVAIRNSFANDIIHTVNNAQAHATSSSSSKSLWGLVSYFGRINYGYKEKYLLSASYRTDGSSRFGKDNKWGVFPALAGAWRISEEGFWQLSAINELRLRASYGVTGNMSIGNFAALGNMGTFYYTPDDVLTAGMVQTSFENRDLSWETTHSYDYGILLGLLDNRLLLNFDYYIKKTTNLLYTVSVPTITGFSSALDNIGEIENKGFEIELTTKNLTGKFTWNTSFNMARNKNQVIDLGGIPERIATNEMIYWLLRPGEPMFSYYGYKIVGIFMNSGDLEKYPKLSVNKVGDPIFQDTNKDGEITPDDRVVLGNYHPDYTMGMVNDFTWKRFDLNITMQASLGGEIQHMIQHYQMGRDNGGIRLSVVKNQFWSEDDPGDGKTPSLCRTRYQIYNYSDWYLANASFLAIRNINLGYTLPIFISQKVGINNLRIYTSITNPLVITSKEFDGVNPEGMSRYDPDSAYPGIDRGSVPLTTNISLGVNVTF